MLEYDRIDISEGIDINKCGETFRRCSLCNFYYFLDKNFSDCNWIRTHNHLVHKRTLNHLAKLAK